MYREEAGLTFFVCEEGWVQQKMRLEKKKACVWGLRVKIVFLLHSANTYSTNTNPNPFIKQGLRK
jgi:hypothetical protein